MNILFVCLGNICRSPSAEGIFKNIVNSRDLNSLFYIDSAGTSGYHVGEMADSRMRKFAQKRGYNLASRSRKFIKKDFADFDYIIAMDSSNLKDILSLDQSNKYHGKVKLMTDFSINYLLQDVPDPYYGGDEGFNNVIDILEESCNGFLDFLIKNKEI